MSLKTGVTCLSAFRNQFGTWKILRFSPGIQQHHSPDRALVVPLPFCHSRSALSTNCSTCSQESALGGSTKRFVEFEKTIVLWPSALKASTLPGESSRYRSAPTAALSFMNHRSQ